MKRQRCTCSDVYDRYVSHEGMMDLEKLLLEDTTTATDDHAKTTTDDNHAKTTTATEARAKNTTEDAREPGSLQAKRREEAKNVSSDNSTEDQAETQDATMTEHDEELLRFMIDPDAYLLALLE